jgi:hypothetical protein
MTSVRELLDNAANRAAAGALDDALAAYAAALARSPQLAEAHYNVAALRLKKGDLAGAEVSPSTRPGSTGRRRSWVGASGLQARQVRRRGAGVRTCSHARTGIGRGALQSGEHSIGCGLEAPCWCRAPALAPENEEICNALRSHCCLPAPRGRFEDFAR